MQSCEVINLTVPFVEELFYLPGGAKNAPLFVLLWLEKYRTHLIAIAFIACTQ